MKKGTIVNNTEELQRARDAMDREDYIEAEIHARQVLVNDCRNNEALKIICRIAAACRRADSILYYYRQYDLSTDRDLEFVISMAEFFCSEGKPKVAAELLRQAAQFFPEDGEVENRLQYYSYLSADMDIFPAMNFSTDGIVGKGSTDKLLFHVITVVYGEEFTDRFVSEVIPTQLGSDNIEALNRDTRSLYVIYTTPADAQKIQSAAVFRSLVATMDVRIYCVDPAFMNSSNKYELMILCHRHALRKAHELEARVVFLAPDAVFSNVTFHSLFRRAKQGFKAVMIGTLRVSKEDFLPQLRKLFFTPERIEAPIAARKLVDLALKHLHPDTRNAMIGSENFNGWPSQLLRKIPGEGILGRNFHLHPLMVHPETFAEFHGTVDDDCVGRFCNSMDDIYIVHDSDEMTGFDFSSLQTRAPQMEGHLDTAYTASWVEDHTDDFHRRFVEHELRIHNGGQSAEWDRAGKETAELVAEIKNYRDEGKEHFFPAVLADRDLRYPPIRLEHIHFQPAEDSAKLLREITDLATGGRVRQLTLGFCRPTAAGDPLEISNWEKEFGLLTEKLEQVNLVSKLYQRLSEEQCRILGKFSRITVMVESCFTAIPPSENSRKQLDDVLLNMDRILQATESESTPRFEWNLPLSSGLATLLPEIAEKAISGGVLRIICTEPFAEQTEEKQNSSSLSLPAKELEGIRDKIGEVRSFCAEHGTELLLPLNWGRNVADKIAIEKTIENFGIEIDLSAAVLRPGPELELTGAKGRFFRREKKEPLPGETRRCTAPWNEIWITAAGEIHTCPLRTQVMGEIGRTDSLRKALHAAEYTALRRQLITGNVTDRTCRNCPLKKVIPHRKLKKIVADMIRAAMADSD